MTSWILGTGFVLLVLAGLAIELTARRAVPRRPTLAELTAILTTTRTTRFITVTLWLWVGWHFLAR